MAITLQASTLLRSSLSQRRGITATLFTPNIQTSRLSLPNKNPTRDLVEELNLRSGFTSRTTSTQKETTKPELTTLTRDDHQDLEVVTKLYSIMEAAADRAEMHANIGTQRDNWNHLFLTSINAMTLTAATMAGIAAISTGTGASVDLAFKLSSTLLYSTATGMLVVMNKIQPSQLAEEQRNATRLFKQLQNQIQTILALGTATPMDVKDAMAKVLALDKAYPLPLIGTMLEKFPATVEPAMWWPQQKQQEKGLALGLGGKKNGWSPKLEDQMRGILGVLKRKDSEEYLRLSKTVLKINKILAISSPLLTGLAALGSAFVSHGSWAVVLGAVAGALSTVLNTLEHGGQVGMVFEMYRGSAGFFRLMEESIESNLKERDVEKRENGELLEMKVALQLGRSLSELRDLAGSCSSSRINGQTSSEEFASKLF